MPTSVILPENQELALNSLVGSGAYKTQSEILRAALEDFLHHAPRPVLLDSAVWAYKEGLVSLSKAAVLAEITHAEMQVVLAREGLLNAHVSTAQMDAEADFLASQ